MRLYPFASKSSKYLIVLEIEQQILRAIQAFCSSLRTKYFTDDTGWKDETIRLFHLQEKYPEKNKKLVQTYKVVQVET